MIVLVQGISVFISKIRDCLYFRGVSGHIQCCKAVMLHCLCFGITLVGYVLVRWSPGGGRINFRQSLSIKTFLNACNYERKWQLMYKGFKQSFKNEAVFLLFTIVTTCVIVCYLIMFISNNVLDVIRLMNSRFSCTFSLSYNR